MAKSNRHFFAVIFVLFTFSSHACRQFIVGGKDGWRINPSEDYYNRWSEQLRFYVNDTLFKFKKGSDSVLVVNKDDYDRCNTANPTARMDGGDSIFKFYRTGPFFFISSNESSCGRGEKLVTVVLAVRNDTSHPPRTSPPTPGSSPSESPPNQSFAAAARCSSVVLVLTLSLALSVCLAGFIG